MFLWLYFLSTLKFSGKKYKHFKNSLQRNNKTSASVYNFSFVLQNMKKCAPNGPQTHSQLQNQDSRPRAKIRIELN